MKMPMLPIHVVTSETLAEVKAKARAEGTAEGKAFSNTQIEMLLYHRTMKPLIVRANKKNKLKQKGVSKC